MARISKRFVDGLRPGAKQRIEWDNDLKGFGVVVRPSGVHSFVFSYRNAQNRKGNITIGKIGGLPPEAARRKAEEYRRVVLDGRDPLVEKSETKKAITIGNLIDAYLTSEAFKAKAPSTQAIDRGRIENHLRPLLGKTPLPTFSMLTVERSHRAIVNGKTAKRAPSKRKRGRVIVTGGEGTARMAIRLLRAILSWGRKANLVPADAVEAARNVNIGRDGRRSTILDDPEAYARLWKTLDRLTDPDAIGEGEKPIRKEVADAIRVIALTGARRGEIIGLRWSHVDLNAGTLTLPINAHKTGRKTGEQRVIGLPSLASAIISRQPDGIPGELVFRPSRGGSQLDLSKPWRSIRTAAGLPVGIGLHGLRHSLASHMAMQGAEAAEIMTALGHRDIATSQRYVHWAHDNRQDLAEKAAAGITAAVTKEGSENDSRHRGRADE